MTLSSRPGSDASFNIAKGHLLGTYFTRGVGGTATILQSDSTAVLTAPEGIDGASSYTFSVTGAFTDYDESSSAMATFTSTITLNAPTLEGTFFTVSNTLQTPADWVTGSTLAEGGRASQSGLATFMEAMEGGMVEFYNGWTDSPRSPTQWARLTATGDSIGYAQGRSFYLEQTANVATIGTSENYVPVSASPSSMVLTQMLSGTYRGHAAPDSFYSSDGFLDINIIVPEPSTYAALAGLAVFAVAVIRRRKRAL